MTRNSSVEKSIDKTNDEKKTLFNKQFFQNYFGFKLSDDDMKKISNPKAEVQFHVAMKFLQTGAITGYFIGGTSLLLGKFSQELLISPYRSIIKPEMPLNIKTNKEILLITTRRLARNFMIGSFLLSFPCANIYEKLKGINYDGYYDRAYRIRYNQGQLNVDRGCIIFSLISMAFCIKNKRPVLLGIPPGFLLGTVILAVYNNTSISNVNKIINNK